MSLFVTLLVLAAAVMHASWNALIKAGSDKVVMQCLVMFFAGLPCLPLLLFVPLPNDGRTLHRVNVLIRAEGDPGPLIPPSRRAAEAATAGTHFESGYTFEDLLTVGAHFETLLQGLARNRARTTETDDDTGWIARQLVIHRGGRSAEELQFADGSWLRVAAQRTQEGGIVTTLADISTLKHRELELADLVARLEIARDQATDVGGRYGAGGELRARVGRVDTGLPLELTGRHRLDVAPRGGLAALKRLLDRRGGEVEVGIHEGADRPAVGPVADPRAAAERIDAECRASAR